MDHIPKCKIQNCETSKRKRWEKNLHDLELNVFKYSTESHYKTVKEMKEDLDNWKDVYGSGDSTMLRWHYFAK